MTTTLTHTYTNGHTRYFTVLSAVAGDEPDTAIITTVEDGDIAISAADAPALFMQLLQSGLMGA